MINHCIAVVYPYILDRRECPIRRRAPTRYAYVPITKICTEYMVDTAQWHNIAPVDVNHESRCYDAGWIILRVSGDSHIAVVYVML